MKWSSIKDEINDIIRASMASPVKSNGYSAVIIDPVELAYAWMLDTEESWQNKNQHLNFFKEDMPSERLKKGQSAFMDGRCQTDLDKKHTTINLMPPFISPAMTRFLTDTSSTMPGFGSFGQQRFAALHEVGHWLTQDADPIVDKEVHRYPALLRAEASSDGFAIAWAIANGADPAAVGQDVGLMRTANAMSRFSTHYLTFDIIEPAIEIGKRIAKENNQQDLDPRKIMAEIHKACETCLPSKAFMAEMKDFTYEDFINYEAARDSGLVRKSGYYLNLQEPWKKRDEETWWANLYKNNPDHAALLKRIVLSERVSTLAAICHDENKITPRLAISFVKQIIPFIPDDNKNKRILQDSLISDNTSSAFCKDILNRSAKALSDPLDDVLKKGLTKLASYVMEYDDPENITPKSNLRGTKSPKAPFVVIDIRNGVIDNDNVGLIAENLKGTNIKRLGVIHEDADYGRNIANIIRQYSDNLKIEIMGYDNETALKFSTPATAVAITSGRLSIIGEVPEARFKNQISRS